jgi:hypothetical protein
MYQGGEVGPSGALETVTTGNPEACCVASGREGEPVRVGPIHNATVPPGAASDGSRPNRTRRCLASICREAVA